MRPAVVLLLLAAPAHSQGRGGEPLRKTDLVRLLSGVTLAPDALAALIRRRCLGFTPSGRDRADFVALGADPAALREIDGCVRRAAAPRPSEALPTGDRGVVRVSFVGVDSGSGLVRVAAGDEGSTSLVIVASRQREDVGVTVGRTTPPGMTHCP